MTILLYQLSVSHKNILIIKWIQISKIWMFWERGYPHLIGAYAWDLISNQVITPAFINSF